MNDRWPYRHCRALALLVVTALSAALNVLAATEPISPQVDAGVVRGLAAISRQQQPDGAFVAAEEGGPRLAATALATWAFLSTGNTGGTGRYGLAVRRAVAFLARRVPDDGMVPRLENSGMAGEAQVAVALAEAYGAADDPTDRGIIRATIESMLTAILRAQDLRQEPGKGGWNADGKPGDGDLVTTAWCVLALKAIEDAGFNIPKDRLPKAAGFAGACYHADQHLFADHTATGAPGQAGAALVCLLLAGPASRPPEAAFAKLSADALKIITERKLPDDAPDPYPSWYFMSLAAHLSLEPAANDAARAVRDAILARRADDGSWPPARATAPLGAVSATALAAMALTPAYRLLPLYGR